MSMPCLHDLAFRVIASHSSRGGHFAAIHASSSGLRQNTARPMRSGEGIRPNVMSVYTFAREARIIRPASVAVKRMLSISIVSPFALTYTVATSAATPSRRTSLSRSRSLSLFDLLCTARAQQLTARFAGFSAQLPFRHFPCHKSLCHNGRNTVKC